MFGGIILQRLRFKDCLNMLIKNFTEHIKPYLRLKCMEMGVGLHCTYIFVSTDSIIMICTLFLIVNDDRKCDMSAYIQDFYSLKKIFSIQ